MLVQCGMQYLGLSKNVSKSLQPPAVVTGDDAAAAAADDDDDDVADVAAADDDDDDDADVAVDDAFPPVVLFLWIFHVPAKDACLVCVDSVSSM